MASNGGIPKNLETLIEFLVSHGVKRYKSGQLELEFDLSELALLPPLGLRRSPEPAPVPSKQLEFDLQGAVVESELPKKVGKDGLTAEEQVALYGRVIDAS